jgi:precorrin-6Y C5,15-methyltransferase (decarboxylating)
MTACSRPAWDALKPFGRLVANAVTVEGEARLFALQAVHGGELCGCRQAAPSPLAAISDGSL